MLTCCGDFDVLTFQVSTIHFLTLLLSKGNVTKPKAFKS